ncbi:MAG TPA: N-acetylmuramoyl-L-alanine amidase-like domain-containing protein [Pseudolabrys sp.]|nr:N-acetylmuramoyl-L-alanine amidase-like domain-containing protein [Pseudolabrys sp.]
MPFDSRVNRRDILRILAGAAALAATPSEASEARIERLIAEAQRFPAISQRIDFISGALRGTRYRGYTLIGGPQRPEQFVLRDDGFDCVTFCETVLAAAIARDTTEFETVLREIRYHNGTVNWFERNHYFFEWSQHNVENKTCRPVVMDGAVTIEKTVYWHRELGKRHFAMQVIPRATFMANKDTLASGDIVGFVTQRPNLDYFHVGFIAFGQDGKLLLRHAALSRHRVLDERMDRFVAQNHVRYVTLLRPEQPAAAVARKGI